VCNSGVVFAPAVHDPQVAFEPGETIISQGHSGDLFYIIVEGQVDVSQDGETIRRLQQGQYFGEGALVK